MTPVEASEVISWRGANGERRPLVERLRAHAVMWRNATSTAMSQHATYCDEAADEIERLEVYRRYQSKDTAAQAEEAIEQKRQTGKYPFDD